MHLADGDNGNIIIIEEWWALKSRLLQTANIRFKLEILKMENSRQNSSKQFL